MTEPHWMRNVKWSCTICGKAPPCRCWVQLVCQCGAHTMTERIPEDGDADEIKTECPDCQDKTEPGGEEKGKR